MSWDIEDAILPIADIRSASISWRGAGLLRLGSSIQTNALIKDEIITAV